MPLWAGSDLNTGLELQLVQRAANYIIMSLMYHRRASERCGCDLVPNMSRSPHKPEHMAGTCGGGVVVTGVTETRRKNVFLIYFGSVSILKQHAATWEE